MSMRPAFKLAVLNVARLGDTDVFPYPVDNSLFYDRGKECTDLLEEIERERDLATALERFPLTFDTQLFPVGIFGFRSVTQLDPLWNAYLLGAVIHIAERLEQKRIPVNENVVFSYRFAPDRKEGSLFDKEIAWHEFQAEAVRLAHENDFVVNCDISNFYPRIYHHRLENALQRATPGNHLTPKILSVLTQVSKQTSYGLPVGGNASRILSEIVLNHTDRLLQINGIKFIRFVDDYYLFASDRQKALRNLILLSEKLQQHEGLSLQKVKTKIVTSQEFLATSDFVDMGDDPDESQRILRKFRKVRLHFDPYSMTAEADYATLKEALSEFDIVGMLKKELKKTRVHEPTTSKLLTAIRSLDEDIQLGAIRTVLDNLERLMPLFPRVAILLKSVLRLENEDLNQEIFSKIHQLFKEESPIVGLTVNVDFCVRLLAHDRTVQADALMNSLYQRTESIMLRRDIIHAMTHKCSEPWLADRLRAYSTVSVWERRALLLASFVLTDEGAHWRNKVNKSNAYDSLLLSWASDRKQNNIAGLPL